MSLAGMTVGVVIAAIDRTSALIKQIQSAAPPPGLRPPEPACGAGSRCAIR